MRSCRCASGSATDILDRSRARVLFCIGRFLGQYYPALLDGLRPGSLEHVVVIGDGDRAAEASWDGFLARADAVPAAAVHARESALRPDSTADLMFTSGTTGRPKGVMAGHAPGREHECGALDAGLAHPLSQ